MTKKTIYIFCFNNGDSTQSDHVIGDINLDYDQMVKLATEYIEIEYDYHRDNFEIVEIYPALESFIKQIIESRKK